jgi:tetratricopeptide (TPR) repeat protein
MKATCSISIGVCVFGEAPGDGRIVCAAPEIFSETDGYLALSTVSDWTQFEARDETTILKSAINAHYTQRAQELLEECLIGLPHEMTIEALEQVNDYLQSRVSSESLQLNLMIAPLNDIRVAQSLASIALSSGFGAIASILDQLVDVQPLLKRFVNLWLETPDNWFIGLSRTKSENWRLLITTGKLLLLLLATDRRSFTSTWNSLTFHERSAAARSVLVRLGGRLAEQLEMGKHEPAHTPWTAETEPEYEMKTSGIKKREPWHVLRDRAIKQVTAITDAAALGEDDRARQYLEDLIADQKDTPDHAVKSLCNVAKQCADMFRTDLEYECLKRALELVPSDPWTLIQLGDHYKRVGNYARAFEVLESARWCDQSDVASSSIADVYAQQGDYDRAIAAYQSIPNWHGTGEIRTAVADNLRRRGDLDEAERAYEALIVDGFYSHRAIAGRAEIARRRGDLEQAIAYYEELLAVPLNDERSVQIYRLSLAGLLKQTGRLDQSYKQVDTVIREVPFNRRARILRASILGLRGEDTAALAAIPASSRPNAFGEWVQHYYRGLLLLKLNRFSEAKSELISNLQSALLSGEDRAFLRLAAALLFLSSDDLSSANDVLNQVPFIRDKYAQYLATVLRFHVAVAQGDSDRINRLSKELKENELEDRQLTAAREQIIRRQFTSARRFELEALLKLAA